MAQHSDTQPGSSESPAAHSKQRDESANEIADLAYEAAVRAHAAHLEAVKSYRASVSTLLAIGGVGLSLLAKGAIDLSGTAAGISWLPTIVASILSVAFIVLGIRCLRLKEGLLQRQRLSDLVALQDQHPAQIRFEMAEAIDEAVELGQRALQKLLWECALATAILILAVVEWFAALAI